MHHVLLVRERGLFPPTTRARRCAIIDAAEVDDQAIRIVGSKDILQAAIDSKQTDNGKCWWFCSQVARRRDGDRNRGRRRFGVELIDGLCREYVGAVGKP